MLDEARLKTETQLVLCISSTSSSTSKEMAGSVGTSWTFP